jgi:hypothetical protein
MEPITTLVGIALWEYIAKPLADKAKDRFSDTLLDGVLNKFNLKNDTKDTIKLELSNLDDEILKDKTKFLKYFDENNKIKDTLKQYPNSKVTVNGNVKGVVNAESDSVIHQTIS